MKLVRVISTIGLLFFLALNESEYYKDPALYTRIFGGSRFYLDALFIVFAAFVLLFSHFFRRFFKEERKRELCKRAPNEVLERTVSDALSSLSIGYSRSHDKWSKRIVIYETEIGLEIKFMPPPAFGKDWMLWITGINGENGEEERKLEEEILSRLQSSG